MPSVSITSANNAGKYKPPHERSEGPWEDYELDDGMRHLDMASKIVGNKKYVEAIKRHGEKKAHETKQIAHRASMLARAGQISSKQMEKIGSK